jgi:hypothetical protein
MGPAEPATGENPEKLAKRQSTLLYWGKCAALPSYRLRPEASASPASTRGVARFSAEPGRLVGISGPRAGPVVGRGLDGRRAANCLGFCPRQRRGRGAPARAIRRSLNEFASRV